MLKNTKSWHLVGANNKFSFTSTPEHFMHYVIINYLAFL